jgi:hypothetical protein
MTVPVTLCALFLTSYGIEIINVFKGYGSIGLQIAYALRALVWIWFIFMEIRVHKVPGKMHLYLSIARISLYAMAVALVMPILLPKYMLAWEHVIFITGFMSLTLSIASRVLAAHAGRLEILSMHGRMVKTYGILIVLSMLTRVATDIWPGSHFMHLAIASALALTALYLWGKIFVPLVKIYPGR